MPHRLLKMCPHLGRKCNSRLTLRFCKGKLPSVGRWELGQAGGGLRDISNKLRWSLSPSTSEWG